MFQEEFEESSFESSRSLVKEYEGLLKRGEYFFWDEQSYEQIINFYIDRGKAAKAFNVVALAEQQHPYSARVYLKKAQVFFEQQKLTQALESLNKAKILDSSDLEIYILEADIHLIRKQSSKAIQCIKKAISFADEMDLPDLYLEMADLYEDQLEYSIAYKYIKKALFLHPENEEAMTRINLTASLADKNEDSIDYHKKYINEYPYSFLAWYNLGYAYKEVGLYEKALYAYEYVLIINEHYEYVYKEYADVLEHLERYDEAENYCLKYIKLFGQSYSSYIQLGDTSIKAQRYNRAISYYKKAIAIDAQEGLAYIQLGKTYSLQGLMHLVGAYYKKAVAADGNNHIYLTELAYWHNLKGEVEESYEMYLKAINLEPTYLTAWQGLTTVAIEAGIAAMILGVFVEHEETVNHSVDLILLKGICLYTLDKREEGMRLLVENKDKTKLKKLLDVYPYLNKEPDIINFLSEE